MQNHRDISININLKFSFPTSFCDIKVQNLILLASQHHRDRWTQTVGRHKNGIQPAQVRTLVASALHKSMINSRPSLKVSWHTACSACQSRQMLMPLIMLYAISNVIYHNNTRCVVIYRNLTEIINLGDNIGEKKINHKLKCSQIISWRKKILDREIFFKFEKIWISNSVRLFVKVVRASLDCTTYNSLILTIKTNICTRKIPYIALSLLIWYFSLARY